LPDVLSLVKGVSKLEQLNIVGKRSGNGFVTHRVSFVKALSRVIAERITIGDRTLGRKGLLSYLKTLTANAVKVYEADNVIKIEAGNVQSTIPDLSWVGDNTAMTYCKIEVHSAIAIDPNIGASELADALDAVLPYTARDDNRPVLQCVKIESRENEIIMAGADGFRLAVKILHCNTGDSRNVVVAHRDELKGIASALRKASRVHIEVKSDELEIQTEAITYSIGNYGGKFPDYEKLIPTEATTTVHIDTVEAGKAVQSLIALDGGKLAEMAIDIVIDGAVELRTVDSHGIAPVSGEVVGEPITIRANGGYLRQALKSCSGMVDMMLTNANAPLLFKADDYQLVVMPLMIEKPKAEAEAETVSEPEAVEVAEPEAQAEAVAEPEEPKRKRSKVTAS